MIIHSTKNIFLIISFLLMNLFSCNSEIKKEEQTNKYYLNVSGDQKNINEIISSNKKAVYLQFDTLGTFFCSIVLLDLNSGKSVEIVDNRFYNTTPILYDDGNKIMFASARMGDPLRLRITTNHAPRQFYSIDLNDLFLIPFYYDSGNSGTEELTHFVDISWNQKQKELYFATQYNFSNNKVYSFSSDRKEPQVKFEIDKKYTIWHLGISPNNKYLAVEFLSMEVDTLGLYVYDLQTSKLIYELYNNKKPVRYLGWSNLSHLYISKDYPLEVDIISKSSKRIDFGLNENDYWINNVLPENENSVILLVDKLKYDPIAKYNVATSTEVARYNFQSKEIEWLTNDRFRKYSFSIYIASDPN